MSVSISTLYRWRVSGLLVAGTDYRRKFPSANSPILYHLQRVEERMMQMSATDIGEIEPVLG